MLGISAFGRRDIADTMLLCSQLHSTDNVHVLFIYIDSVIYDWMAYHINIVRNELTMRIQWVKA